MKKTAVEWLEEMFSNSEIPNSSMLFQQAKEMERKEKLKRQLFIGKVSEIIGSDKTVELLKECNETFNQ